MRRRLVSLFFIVVLVFLLSVTSFASGMLGDSPWPRARRDNKNTGSTDIIGPSEPEIKWVYESSGQMLYSTPVIGIDGTIYIGTMQQANEILAINPDGTLKWKIAVEGGPSPWVQASGAVGKDGTLYIGYGATAPANYNLLAINPDGTIKWKVPTGAACYGSPGISNNGLVYFSAGTGAGEYKLMAFNLQGEEKWTAQASNWIYTSPATADDGTIYFGGRDGHIRAIDPKDASLKWAYYTGAQFFSSPAIGSDGTIYCGSRNNTLWAVTPKGERKGFFLTPSGKIESSPAIGKDNTVYFAAGNLLYAVKFEGMLLKEKWSFKADTTSDVTSSPIIDGNGTVYIGTNSGMLYAINPDGTLKWQVNVGGTVGYASPVIGANGTIYVPVSSKSEPYGKLVAIGEK